MNGLTLRNLQPELMDDPSIDPLQHEQALNGLARIHRLNRTPQQIWKTIRSRVEISDSKTLSILDIGCGDGFLLRQLYRLASADGVSLTLAGCDISSTAISIGEDEAEGQQAPIVFHKADIVKADELPAKADVVICSLFLHHFDEPSAVKILKTMNLAASQMVLVHDLRRTQLGYFLCWIGVHLFSRSKVVHTDGLLSVRAAFSVDEIKKLLGEAGIQDARVTMGWPQRFNATWLKREQLQ